MVEIDIDNTSSEGEGNPLRTKIILFGVIGLVIVVFLIYAFSSGHPSATIVNGTTVKVSGDVQCKLVDGNPDRTCTPGTILAVPAIGLCSPSYMQPEIDEVTALQVYQMYGITDRTGWAIEHYTPLILGGTNDIENLYPMSELPKPGYIERDKAAQKLKDMMCAGTIPLEAAQYEITHEWKKNPALYQ